MTKLSAHQIELLKLMAQAKERGLYWLPPRNGSQYLKSEDRFIVVMGSSSAASLRALWRKGLAKPVKGYEDMFMSQITDAGLKTIQTIKSKRKS